MNQEWRLPTRVGFRFVFIYLVLFTFPGLYEPASDWVSLLSPRLIPWVSAHALNIEVPAVVYSPGALGDSAQGTAHTLFLLALAAVAVTMWSIADRKRLNYNKLHQWFRLYLRLYVGAAVLGYGAAKVFPVQVREPTLSTLLAPFGDLAPTAVLWSFMGSSTLYTVFTGLVETMGAVLMFVPRLTTIGAMICAAALANVFMLNVSYDVVVKQYAFHLLLMSVFLIGPDLRKLGGYLIFNRKIEPAPDTPFFQRRWLNYALLILQLAYGGYVTATDFARERQTFKTYTDLQQTTPFYGIWTVDEFTLDGVTRPPLTTDNLRWLRLIVDRNVFYPGPPVVIQTTSGTHKLFVGDFDANRTIMRLKDPKDDRVWDPGRFPGQTAPSVAEFTLENPQPDRLILEGEMDGQHVHAILQRTPIEFTLRKRGFHWIQNSPFFGEGIVI